MADGVHQDIGAHTRVPGLGHRSLMPRSSCERITPEFPRAPIREP